MIRLINKIIVKVGIVLILCVVISIVINSFAPHFSNDMALGQLENEDINWSLMNIWNQIQNYINWIYVIIILPFGISIYKDFYKFFKRNGEI